MLTRKQIAEMREKNARPLREKQEKKAAKLVDEYEKKQSHDWLQSHYKNSPNSVQPVIGYCKKCGVDYYVFKSRPEFCPKQIKKE